MKQKHYQGFTQVNKILPGKIKEYKLEKAFYKHQALKYWQAAAAKFLEQAEEQTHALDLRNGILVVACLSKELAYQIKLLAQRIAYELNRLIGKAVVFAIYTEI